LFGVRVRWAGLKFAKTHHAVRRAREVTYRKAHHSREAIRQQDKTHHQDKTIPTKTKLNKKREEEKTRKKTRKMPR
jgi:hypothetical protein